MIEIVNGGISRFIEEYKLAEYTQKGFEQVKVKEKQLEDMTIAELKAYAMTNNIEIGAATKKPDILTAILAGKETGEDNDGTDA